MSHLYGKEDMTEGDANIEHNLINAFQEYVREYFSFLADSEEFEGPYILKSGPLTAEVGYTSSNISVVLILDVRDGLVDCQIRSTAGTMPASYGEGYQEYLPILLWRKGVPRKDLRVVLRKGMTLEERIKEQVKHYAKLFKTYGIKAVEEYKFTFANKK